MTSNGYDVRAIANLVINVAKEEGANVTNLSLNKIIYFLHVAFLNEFRRPLVSAKIEAWENGPVFREIYHQFKRFGRSNITDLARRIDPITGAYEACCDDIVDGELDFLRKSARQLVQVSPGKLVGMSHVTDGAWFKARHANGGINPGAEITNAMIAESGKEAIFH